MKKYSKNHLILFTIVNNLGGFISFKSTQENSIHRSDRFLKFCYEKESNYLFLNWYGHWYQVNSESKACCIIVLKPTINQKKGN